MAEKEQAGAGPRADRAPFVKSRAGAPSGFFAAEAAGLRWLAEPGAAPVVAVLEVREDALHLVRLESASPDAESARDLVGFVKAEQRRKFNFIAMAGGGLVTLGFVAQLFFVLRGFTSGQQAFPALTGNNVDDVRMIGTTIFTTHHLPLQVVGVLILVATVGVVVLSKRELK